MLLVTSLFYACICTTGAAQKRDALHRTRARQTHTNTTDRGKLKLIQQQPLGCSSVKFHKFTTINNTHETQNNKHDLFLGLRNNKERP